uniref:Potassium channel tetramerization domain containing 14 n=1 Tax=Eptatretus burgeri TaxID=7764 RepID=A0A8C4NCU0_EPTBU
MADDAERSSFGTQTPPLHSAVIQINVGGTIFTTTSDTLRSCPGSRMAEIPCPPHSLRFLADSAGRPFVDRDPTAFAYVLRFLRGGGLPPAGAETETLQEALYWRVEPLVKILEESPQVFGENVGRKHFVAQIPNYHENLELMIRLARAEALAARLSRVLVFVQKIKPTAVHEGETGRPGLPHNGHATIVKYGPWTAEPGVTDLLDSVKTDIVNLGYNVEYRALPEDRPFSLFRESTASNEHGLFEFIFHWW